MKVTIRDYAWFCIVMGLIITHIISIITDRGQRSIKSITPVEIELYNK